ncbi:MAG: ATP-grasp domain-containing protein [Hyphomicrobiaceae bacterium]
MTSPASILIASFSGRALATSARRAGLRPLVVDAFGDVDTRQVADKIRVLPGAFQHGFRAKTLLPALRDLTEEATSSLVGLVLGSGFEDKPRLIATLAKNFKLLGCSSDTVRACKNPFHLHDALTKHQIPTPPVANAPPNGSTRRWLRKHIGATGGGHISDAATADPSHPNTYVQGYIQGRSISALCLANGAQGRCDVIGFSEQWCTPTEHQTFRFGGGVGPIELSDDMSDAISRNAEKLSLEFQLQGLVALDYIATEDQTAHLIEVNPRPSATLDLFETNTGDLLTAHIRTCQGASTHTLVPSKTNTSRASSYLYADHGPVSIKDLSWPAWCCDRPSVGTKIPRQGPIATITAQADAPKAAKKLCQTRLGELCDMIYNKEKTEAQPE